MIETRIPVQPKPKIQKVEVYWHTVTYTTIAIYVVILLAVILGATFLIFPEKSGNLVKRITAALTKPSNAGGSATARQVRFVNLDGKVQVKKVDSVQW